MNSSKGSKMSVKTLLEDWAAAFSAENVESIITCYSKDAVLWGTFSAELRQTPEAIRDYFEPYFALKVHRIKFEELFIQTYGDAAVASGIYKVSLSKENTLEVTMARFSFTCLNQDGRWWIVNHHSSLVPE